MVGKQKFVTLHRRLQTRHQQSARRVAQMMARVIKHPGSWVNGRWQGPRAQGRPSWTGKLQNRARIAYGSILPAQLRKVDFKTLHLVKAPAGMTKTASGLFSALKKGWHMIKRHFHKHKGAIASAAKKHASAAAKHVGSRVGEAAARSGKRMTDRIVSVAERNVDHYTSKAERKIDALATRAEKHISKYDKPRR